MLIDIGLLRRELHPFITVGEIWEGSLVEITNYELGWAKGKDNRDIAYLRILDLYEYGNDGRKPTEAYDYEIAPVLASPRPKSPRGVFGEQNHDAIENVLAETSIPVKTGPVSDGIVEEEVSLIKYPEEIRQSGGGIAEKRLEKAGSKRKREESPTPLKESDPNISSSPKKIARLGPSHSPYTASKVLTKPSKSFPTTAAIQLPTKTFMHPPEKVSAHAPPRQQSIMPNEKQLQPSNPLPPRPPPPTTTQPETPKKTASTKLIPIPRPLVLSPLSSLTGRNTSRNKPVDVLVVVSYVSSEIIQRPGVPLSRNIRIRDTSTTKPVLLSVFTSPRTFLPKEGDIALFRNVTTHDFDQGSLKAWESWCEGRAWYVKEEELGRLKGIEDWDKRVQRLRELWEVIKDEQRLFQDSY